MKSKAVLFQKEIRMETCLLILHSILATHYWTALMGPAKKQEVDMQLKVSGRDWLRTQSTRTHGKGKDEMQNTRETAFSCYCLSPFYLLMEVLDF